MKKRTKPKNIINNGLPIIKYTLRWQAQNFLELLKIRNYSPRTLDNKEKNLNMFFKWCDERELTSPTDISRAIIERYQKYLFYYKKKNNEPLSIRCQHNRLSVLKGYFSYICKENDLVYNPAFEIELPKVPKRLPRGILSVEEVEKILSCININNIYGLRDRAMIEILYSTGIRRAELSNLSIYDLDRSRRILFIREGKGRKDRVVPIGQRAISWCEKYLNEARVKLSISRENHSLFLNYEGDALNKDKISHLVRGYIVKAEINKAGSCHLFRHTCATLMLEHGADIRYIQQMLGHSSLNSTEIYTQVSIKKLQEIHEATHPAKDIRTKTIKKVKKAKKESSQIQNEAHN